MPPQQNSTFIEDDSILKPKLHSNQCLKDDAEMEEEEEEEIIKRYSPILPPITTQLNESDNEDCYAYKMHEKQNPQMKKFRNLNTNDLHDASQKYCQNNNGQHRKGNRIRNGNSNFRNSVSQSCQSRRSRSISLHGVNSTMEQGQKELTIWIDNEPRYISGVTKKTTCSDIIKALIDDELQNGNSAFFKSIPKERAHTNLKDGGDGVCATSRDYSDYVITESWRGIERSYDSNMTILPVWKAWSRVHNELRLRLRHCCEIQDPIKYVTPRPQQSLLRKYLCKLTRFWRKEKPENPRTPTKSVEVKEKCLLRSNKANIHDEFLFVILPDNVYEKQRPHARKLQTIHEKPAASAMHRRRSRRSVHLTRKSIASRKKTERGVTGVSVNNCIRRRQPTGVSNSIRGSVRYKLAQKTSEMNRLYAREYVLTRELSEKCKLYRLQNQIYSNPDQQWNISIGQVQRKIENYAKEIVRTEHELLELKNEIKQDISLINNLKRMTLDRGGDERAMALPTSEKPPKVDESKPASEMQFVDNIYEFCDNNASMLV